MGSFVASVRQGKAKGPQQNGFDVTKWTAAYKAVASPDAADDALHAAGLCFAKEFAEARQVIDRYTKEAECVNPTEVIVGLATQQWGVIKDKAQAAWRASAANKEFVSEQISELRIPNIANVPFDPEVAIETLVDGLRFPLSTTFPQSSRSGDERRTFGAMLHLFGLGGYYHALEQWWMQCVWNDHSANHSGDDVLLRPASWGSHQVQAISRFRQEARRYEAIIRSATMWNTDLPQEFKAAVLNRKRYLKSYKRSGKARLKLAKLGEVKSELPTGALARAMLSQEYLDVFLAKGRKEFLGLSISKLLDAYELLSHIADQFRIFLPGKMEIRSPEDAIRFVPRIQKSELLQVLSDGLQVGVEQAQWLLGYLTFPKQVRFQLWFKPLVTLSETEVALVLAAVDGVNFVRLTDHLLFSIKELEDEVGDLFEKHVRETLTESAKSFAYESEFALLPRAFTFSVPGAGEEEIDLVYRLGNKIFIGEIKAVMHPSEPLEVYRYIERLRAEGAMQAMRKAGFVSQHIHAFTKTIDFFKNLDPATLQVCPLVVTNTPFFSGFEINGVPVTDLLILPLYFSQGFMETSGYPGKDGRLVTASRTVFYKTREEAVDNHESYLRRPPQVTILEPHLTLDEFSYPVPYPAPHKMDIQLFQVHYPYDTLRAEVEAHRKAGWKTALAERIR
jgi:hypothetical protein